MALLSSILTGGVNNHPTTSEEANAWSTDFISEGIVGSYTNTSGVAPATGAFAVNAQGTPDMTVAVSTGVAYVQGTPTSQNSQTFRIKNTASSNVTISANSSGSTKYDWVYIKLDATKLNGPNVAGDDAATLVTSRSTSQSSDDGTPPTYGYPIAIVTVSNGATSITNGNIRDLRANCIVNLGSSSVSSGWTDLGYAPNTVTANGNRSYSLVFNSVDLTGTVSNGMRLKLPRTVTPPTQCADLESSSSQYFSKTSPSGLSFTTAFTCSAWIKLESYVAGGIIARRNADTEGWSFGVDSSGKLTLRAYRIASNNKVGVSSQSLPLNKWVHVAASMDVTSSSTSTATKMYIDGVAVPSLTTTTGTATALVQGTTALVVGAEKSAGTNPFDGKIAQVAVYSAEISAATILAAMNQTLTGSETNLVSAFSLNNTINDLSANANNLSAINSATATNVDSPMNATEYGIIMANSFSTNTTLTVQVPEGYSLPTTGGISLVSYSTQKTPYGFPGQRGKWAVKSIYKTVLSQTIPVADTWYNLGSASLLIPAGQWDVNIDLPASGDRNTAGSVSVASTLSTSSSAETNTLYTQSREIAATGATGIQDFGANRSGDYEDLSSATTYYALVRTRATTVQTIYQLADRSVMKIEAVPATI